MRFFIFEIYWKGQNNCDITCEIILFVFIVEILHAIENDLLSLQIAPEVPIGQRHLKPRSTSSWQMPLLRQGLWEQESSVLWTSGGNVSNSVNKNMKNVGHARYKPPRLFHILKNVLGVVVFWFLDKYFHFTVYLEMIVGIYYYGKKKILIYAILEKETSHDLSSIT